MFSCILIISYADRQTKHQTSHQDKLRQKATIKFMIFLNFYLIVYWKKCYKKFLINIQSNRANTLT